MPMPTLPRIPAAALALLAAMLAACASPAPTATPTPAPTPTPTATPAPTPTPTPTPFAVLTGAGSDTRIVELDAGDYVLDVSVTGAVDEEPLSVTVSDGDPWTSGNLWVLEWSHLFAGTERSSTSMIEVGRGLGQIPVGYVSFAVEAAESAAQWTIAILPAESFPAVPAPGTLRGEGGLGTEIRFIDIEAGEYVLDVSVEHGDLFLYVGNAAARRRPHSFLTEEARSGRVYLEVGDGPGQLPPGRMPLKAMTVDSGPWAIDVRPASAIPAEPAPIALSGTGPDVQFVDLAPGRYEVETRVSGNEICREGRCSRSDLVVFVGTPSGGIVTLAEDSADDDAAEWSQTSIIGVGDGFSRIAPGRNPVEVSTASSAQWTVDVRRLPPIPEPPARIVLTGTGEDDRSVLLGAGLYVLDVSVTGNVDETDDACGLPVCESPFSVEVGEGLWASRPVSESGAEWSGRSLISLDYDPLGVAPGGAPFRIEAASGAQWTISIQPAASAPAEPAPLTLSGTGDDVRLVDLEPGGHILDVAVEGNDDCTPGPCSGGELKITAMQEGGASEWETLSFSERGSNWSGTVFFEADGGAQSSPGKTAVAVEAEQAATWTIDILPAASVAAGPAPTTLTGSGRDVRLVDFAPGLYVVEARVAGQESCGDTPCRTDSFSAWIGAPDSDDSIRVRVDEADWSGKRIIAVGGAESVPPGRSPVVVEAQGPLPWTVDIRPVTAAAEASAPTTLSGMGQDVRFVQFEPGAYDVNVAVTDLPPCPPYFCKEAFSVETIADGALARVLTIASNLLAAPDRSQSTVIHVGHGPGQFPPGVTPLQVRAAPSAKWELAFTRR